MTIQVEVKNAIGKIILNRPEKLNALSAELLDALSQVLHDFQHNDAVKGILITGSGEKAFSAGADISRLADITAEQGYAFAVHGQSVFRLLETLGKPSIAAVNGFAFGGGCELAMAASLRIASENAQFGQPEVKLGVIPGFGGTQRLARLVGKGRAMELCLSGRFISADEALRWGLVNAVTSRENIVSEAENLLQKILQMAPLALRSVMEVIDTGYDLSLPDAFQLEALHFAKTCATQDRAEGVAAFLGKRAPVFMGK